MVRPNSSTNLSFRCLVVAACLLTGVARADDAPPFPTDPMAWINSGPLTVSGLKGKGVVLWFFEEESPEIRNRWAALMTMARKYDEQPIVFIAVNSGNQRGQVEAYVRDVDVKAPWIVLVDQSRDFEKACKLIQEINPQNTSQIRYIKPDGEILPEVMDDITEAAKSALEGAEWKIEPSTIPPTVKPAWWAVEFGNYKGLAGSLKKFQASPKADVKEAAGRLMGIVTQEIDAQMTAIKEAQEGGNPYRAYELVSSMSDRFTGFELPKDVANIKKDLSKDAKVKAGIAAVKSMEQARKQLATPATGTKSKTHEKATAVLEKIVADFPETALAVQAKSILDYAK